MESKTISGRELTTIQTGGPCTAVISVSNEAGMIAALSAHPEAVCIGGGSNLLISDDGYDGPLVRAVSSEAAGVLVDAENAAVHVEATVVWDDLVAATIDAGLQGLEATSGVPGSVGGAVVQNLGAYGQEFADVIVAVDVWDRDTRGPLRLNKEECGFGYRTSAFKRDPDRRRVVTGVHLQLARSTVSAPRYGDVSELLAKRHGDAREYTLGQIRNAVLSVRTAKGMVLGTSLPSAGSFFTNPVLDAGRAEQLESEGYKIIRRSDGAELVSAAALLEGAGYRRGHERGSVGLSEHHVLALVNRGGATTADVLDLAFELRTTVHDRFGIWLKPEPVMLGFRDDPFASGSSHSGHSPR